MKRNPLGDPYRRPLWVHFPPGCDADRGRRDQYFLDFGAEAFRRALQTIRVTDVFFELFDATHDAIKYRYPIAVKYPAARSSVQP